MSKKEKILVIEDYILFLEEWMEILPEKFDVEVVGVSTIESAAFQLENNFFSLVITDWHLDGELSRDLLVRIREGQFDSANDLRKTSKVPIIIYSAAPLLQKHIDIENVFIIQSGTLFDATISVAKKLLG